MDMPAEGSEPAPAAAAADRGGGTEVTGAKTAAVPVGSTVPDLVMLDAVALSRAIHTKQVSCCEVMKAHLDHIERVNPSANAIVSLRPRTTLMAEVQERDNQLARGQTLGWMHGFPHAVKDLAA